MNAQLPSVGKPVDRVDGGVKVTGKAKYAAGYQFPNLAHAVLVASTVAKGRVTALDPAAAEKSPGVLAVITHKNAPKMKGTEAFGAEGGSLAAGSTTAPLLQTDQIFWRGQPIALVVGGSFEQARFAATLVRATHAAKPHALTFDAKAKGFVPEKIIGEKPEIVVGNAEDALK
ncbi:MAG: Xanthine dehydrogenase [Gemmataceae bacterium]|nr:Xanthine dehydrogenase [Gemmataceae bacterium]